MPVPAIAGGLALGAKAMPFISKHLLSLLIGAGFLGQTALGEYGKSGERKLARAQLGAQAKIAGSSAEAGKLATKESRARAKEYTEGLFKAKREERKGARDVAAMEAFTQSQDRQMALILQAIQAISAQPAGASTAAPAGGGMLGVMRGEF